VRYELNLHTGHIQQKSSVKIFQQ